jgi:cysteinyl-tRNA synthetase
MQWSTPFDLAEEGTEKYKEILPKVEVFGSKIMGYPGWHIECASIILKELGDTVDIHTGGIDHIPVHHTNEIAEAEAVTNAPLANYWIHCNHITVDGTKISKSLGNGYTLADLKNNGFSPLDYRLWVLQGNYRNERNFTSEDLEGAKNRLQNWRSFAALRHQLPSDSEQKIDTTTILSALSDNLNTAEALSLIDQTIAETTPSQESITNFIRFLDTALALNLESSTPDIPNDAKALIASRQSAKQSKDWTAADQIRDELLGKYNILLKDTGNKTIWQYA